MTKENAFIVGKVNRNIAKFFPDLRGELIYQSYGLLKHIQKRHPECTKYVNKIPEIIQFADYIGINPNEKGISFELVKTYENNIQLGIKLDIKENYLYVATLHTITEAKLTQRVCNGRLNLLTKRYK